MRLLFTWRKSSETKANASRLCGGVRGGRAPSHSIKCLQSGCNAALCAAARQIFRTRRILKSEAL
jgi:hypothetical protein